MSREAPQFADQLASILSAPLTPETLTDYGSAALQSVVELIEVAKDAYCSETGIALETGKAVEDKLFQYFNMTEVDRILDQLSLQSDRIAQLDSLVQHATAIDAVTVPPVTDPIELEAGIGNFEQVRTVDKTKTILFVLQQEFGVDIHNAEMFKLYRGEISSNSFRRSPYYVIDAHGISRTVLVCDEIDNKTFVFDSKRLAECGLTALSCGHLSKPELEELISRHQGVGQSVRYSGAYVSNMVRALDDPSTMASINKEVGYLAREIAPEHALGLQAIASCFGISPTSLRRLLDEVSDMIEPVYTSPRGNLYDPWQQNSLRDMLVEKGAISPAAPEGYLSIAGLSRKHGNVSRPRIKQIIEELLDAPDSTELDLPKKYKILRFDGEGLGIPALCYRPEFIAKIESAMEERGLLAPRAPEGCISYGKLRREFGAAIDVVIDELGSGLGEVNVFKFGSVTAPGFLAEQAEIIRQHLPNLHQRPDGYATKNALADMFDIDGRTLKDTIAALGDELGPTTTYRDPKTKRPWDYYSPAQIEQLEEHLTTKGLLSSVVPEGFTTVKQLASDTSLKEGSIYHAVEVLKDQIGEIAIFRSPTSIGGGRPARALSPTQQSIILEYLSNK